MNYNIAIMTISTELDTIIKKIDDNIPIIIYNNKFHTAYINDKAIADENLRNDVLGKSLRYLLTTLGYSEEYILIQYNMLGWISHIGTFTEIYKIPDVWEKILFSKYIIPVFDQHFKIKYLITLGKLSLSIEKTAMNVKLEKLFPNMYLQDIPMGVLGVDGNIIQYVNNKLLKLTGYKPEELVNQNISKIFKNKSYEYIKNSLKTLNKFESEYSILTKELEKIHVWLQGIRIDNNRYLIFIEEVARDRSYQKKYEQLLRENELKEKLNYIGYIAGSFSHEFNNAFMGVLGKLEVLIEQNNDSALINTLTQIKNELFQMSNYTTNLLTITGKQVIKKEYININKFVSKLNEFLKSKFSSIKINIELNSELNKYNVAIDEKNTIQAINLVVSNSVDADSTEVKVILNLERLDEYPNYMILSFITFNPGYYMTISITDNGPGIPDEVIQRIFNPFISTKGKGKGLGLTIVHSIVTSHKGGISINTLQNQGTKVKLYFPIQKTKLRIHKKQIPRTEVKTILVVDDEESVRDITARMCNILGYKTLIAKNGKECIEIYNNNDVDIILLDVDMPIISGQEAYRILSQSHKDLKVILMSGYLEYDLKNQFDHHKDIPFLQKPFTMDKLKNAINIFSKEN